ncbi:hypothetical protein HPB49_011143 [Dermacentor silvarum]|uniref:Uncharacterized protein n=1 Tax=Dermacentor silvarum TaxID=543639 RepID=A0ACB8CEX8_DERSI|nr:hypothetical protein HPB49_011143 [Dermacentor silvarum]
MESQTREEPLLNFSIDLYKHLAEKSGRTGNIFFSPFSISAAPSMALAGARDTTAQQLADVLRVTGAEVRQQFWGLLSKLGGLAPDVKLHVANRMYSEQTFPVLESYLSRLRGSYNATIESVDFRNRYEEVRRLVNTWVEEVTESKIKDLLPDDSVDAVTTLIIVNAIYLKGTWDSHFPPKSTCRMSFRLDSKMKRKALENVEAKQLGARGNTSRQLAKVLHVNSEEIHTHFSRFLSKLDGFAPDVKLSVGTECTLNSRLQLWTPPWNPSTSRTTTRSTSAKLFTSQVFHEAYVDVNEGGTEAAPATPVNRVLCCAYQFNVNRPFMFAIRSLDLEAILLMGSVRGLGTE